MPEDFLDEIAHERGPHFPGMAAQALERRGLVAERERARDLAARLESELAATQQALAQLVLAVERDPDGQTPSQTAALVRAEELLEGSEVVL